MHLTGFITLLIVFLVGEALETYFRQKERGDYAHMSRLACRVFFWAYLANVGYLLLREAAATVRLFP